jgi:Zn-dependent protease
LNNTLQDLDASNSLVSDVEQPSPSVARQKLRLRVPLILFAISVLTTMAIGARFMENFRLGLPTLAADSDLWPWPWLFHNPGKFLQGWPFSVALLTILLAHEFGHYIACRLHGIPTTLPLLLPAPTLSGTAGAVILIRGRIPNRHALMDVGIWGPIAGFCASVPAILIGFWLSRPFQPNSVAPLVTFGEPATLRMAHSLLTSWNISVPIFPAGVFHPIVIAGWVGLFITALNLIPAGQLDGGHVLYALWPRLHRPVTLATAALLFVFGIFFWMGWAFWGLLMLLPAMKHPRVPIEQPLGIMRTLLAHSAIVLLLLTFTAEPFLGSSLLHYFR